MITIAIATNLLNCGGCVSFPTKIMATAGPFVAMWLGVKITYLCQFYVKLGCTCFRKLKDLNNKVL